MPVNIDQSAQFGVLGRRGFFSNRFNYGVVLRYVNKAIAQTSLSILSVWITDTQREVVRTLAVFDEDVEVSFGRRPVAFLFLIRYWIESKSHVVRSEQRLIRIELQFPLTFVDNDTGILNW